MRTTLSDGGYLEHSWTQSSSGASGYILGVRYNAAGQQTARTDPISSTTADYQVIALDNGGFVVGTNYAVRYGYDIALYVFDASTRMSYPSADPSGTAASATSWQIMAGDSGFAFTWLNTGGRTGGYSYDGGFAIYDNAGQMLSKEILTAQPSIALTAEGDYRFSWLDGPDAHPLVVDSESPRDYPPAPTPAGLQLIDDQGAKTGLISAGEVTDDRTPGFRIPVTEQGWVAVSLEGSNNAPNRFVHITTEDVVRGYKDLSFSDAWPNQTYDYGGVRATARFLSADGIPGDSASFTFGLDFHAPNAPAITRVADDAGAQQGDVPAGGSTDDTTPTFQVSLAGTTAQAGDTVELQNGGAPVSSVPISAADVQQGSISVTPTLAGGSHNIAAYIRDAAGNLSPGSSPFAFTIQASGSTPTLSLAGTVSAAEGQSGLTPFTFTVTRSGDLSGTSEASFFVWHESTTAADIGSVSSNRVVFEPGAASKSIVVQVAGDTAVETDEVFHVQLYDPQGATLAANDARGVITNDDSASTGGRVIDSPGPGSTLQGGSGNDTLNASQGADVLTGGGGGDVFAYKALPWNAGRVTDFAVGSDRLDLSAIFQATGYTGSDPVADGRMRFDSDGAGGTRVYFDRDAPNAGDWPFLITTLQGVSPAGLTWAQLSGNAPSGPTAVSDSDTVVRGSSTPATGNVITDASPGDQGDGDDGADRAGSGGPLSVSGIRITQVGDYEPDSAGNFVQGGRFGTVTINVDGSYSYTLSSNPEPGVTDVFGYQVRDAAGNIATASLSIEVLPAGPSGGQVLTWRQHGDTLSGGAGNDTLNASQGPDQLTGGGGGDVFAWAQLPWNAGHVTDFTPGADKLDLRALFQASGYAGSNPVADGRLDFRADGQGNTQVYFDRDAPGGGDWPFLITTLDRVQPSQIGAGDWLFQ
jgi:Ca2+-binding RTX toxin-like protein